MEKIADEKNSRQKKKVDEKLNISY